MLILKIMTFKLKSTLRMSEKDILYNPTFFLVAIMKNYKALLNEYKQRAKCAIMLPLCLLVISCAILQKQNIKRGNWPTEMEVQQRKVMTPEVKCKLNF